MARRTISLEVRTQVLEAAQQDGAKLPEVAKRFGVSLPTVYNWLKAANTVTTETVQA